MRFQAGGLQLGDTAGGYLGREPINPRLKKPAFESTI